MEQELGRPGALRRAGSVDLFADWAASVETLLVVALLCVGTFVWWTPGLWAKKKPPVTKSITGAVLDPSNKGISGASVLLTDVETHQTVAIYSGARGTYTFSGLNPDDDYRIQAKYKNTASDARQVTSLDTRNPMVVNLTLNPPRTRAQPASH